MAQNTLFQVAVNELGYSSSQCLVSTDKVVDATNNVSGLSEWLAIEKGRQLGAHYIYFRRFNNRPSQPLIYIYNYSDRLDLPENNYLGDLHKKIWSSSEVPCAFIFSKNALQIINTSQQPEITSDGLLPVNLLEIAYEINEEIKQRFSSYLLDSGVFWNIEDDFSYNKSAHKTLLNKLKDVREKILIANILSPKLVNRLLIQCVLVRYLEEKEDVDENGQIQRVFPDGFFYEIAKAHSFREAIEKGTFLKIFDYLNDSNHLNGRIFEWTKKEKKELLSISPEQLINFLYETRTNTHSQLAFWDLYSFRFLPVEVISSIYEALFTAESSVKEDGMVYTPPHLATFLVDEAMPITDWQNKESFKILDPACGSGIFLVLAFKRLVHWWRIKNEKRAPSVNDLIGILSNNIHGVDKNENAVLLTRFSLCLTLCDLLSPIEIWSSLHFPLLENKLVHNDFFEWYEKNKSPKFDLVIGNPPFVQAYRNLPNWDEISEVKIPQKQIALYFLCASRKLLKEKGLLSLVLKSSSLLYTKTGNNFRDWFFSSNKIHQILDFTLLRENDSLWENTKPDTLVLFASKEKPTLKDNILHVVIRRTASNSLKRSFEIDSYDFNWVNYSVALKDDFIWKCNLLGGGRIYEFIKRLKTYPTLREYIDKQDGWAFTLGYRASNNPARPKSSHITGKEFLPTENLTEQGINISEFPVETSEHFHHTGDEKIYYAPHILIRANVGKNQIPMIYLPKEDLRFKEKIIGLSAPTKDQQKLDDIFSYLLDNNQLLRAYLFASSSQCLVDRGSAVQVGDIKNLPYLDLGINSLDSQITEFDNILINDIVKYYQDAIRRPESTLMQQPILSTELSSILNKYSKTFCDCLNKVYAHKNYKFTLAESGYFHFRNFIFVIFHYNSNLESKTKFSKKIPANVIEKIENLSTLDKGYASFRRIIKIYEKDTVLFIKPNLHRYWLKSIALRDADDVIADITKPAQSTNALVNA